MTYELLDTKTIDEVLSLLGRYWVEPKHPEHFNAKTIDEAISLLNEYKE